MAKVTLRKDEDFNSLLKRFKKAVVNEGIMEELRKREFYIGPSLKRRLKSEAAQKKNKKNIHTKYIDSRLDY